MKKNVSLILAVSIALGSLGLSGYLYQQLGVANGELQLAQASRIGEHRYLVTKSMPIKGDGVAEENQ